VTDVVMISENSHIARRDDATPRTAEDTIWVIGDVTLIDNRLAILIRNPTTPWQSLVRPKFPFLCYSSLTVIKDPQKNLFKGVIPSCKTAGTKKSDIIAGSSPANTIMGRRMMALYKFVYHDRWRVLPLTTSKLRLITTE
jgi:hypothetical protein